MEMYRQIENISNEDDYYTSDFAKAYKELFAENVDDINDAKESLILILRFKRTFGLLR